ncbi:MAG TPA: hypothetical protein VG271_09170 [Beijerinckiaceae bacterium]|nr:hypothetical protein [Beijerinckiaceae bacterium]
MVSRVTFPAVGAFVLLVCGVARADPVEDFYRGKVVRLIDGMPPGGGYGLYANAIVRHLADHLPGHPTVIYQNMPGAGTLTLTNYLYNIAEKDGTVIGAVSGSAPFTPLLGSKEAQFDASKFNWLPSPSTETGLLVVWHDAPVNRLDDLTRTQIFAGISSENATSGFYGRILNDVFKTKLKLIVGYPQMNDTLLAMERGEVQAFPSAFWSSLKANKPEWLAEKKLKLIVQYGLEPNPEIPDVPVARELAKTDDDRELLDVSMASLNIGRPYMLPPGVPAERLAAMRKAFLDTFADPAFRADAANLHLDVDAAPKSGEEIQKIVADTYAAPRRIIDRLDALFAAEQK